jgi:hypothetical protein
MGAHGLHETIFVHEKSGSPVVRESNPLADGQILT